MIFICRFEEWKQKEGESEPIKEVQLEFPD